MIQVQPKHPRARRLPFVAPIELTDVSSEIQMIERTNERPELFWMPHQHIEALAGRDESLDQD
jgi:hypothetical protein